MRRSSNQGGGRTVLVWLALAALSGAVAPAGLPQNDNQIRPPSDYMSQILSRSTKAIGLREDIALQRMMSQTSREWAVRSSARHILD
jgi:hypothetical protein